MLHDALAQQRPPALAASHRVTKHFVTSLHYHAVALMLFLHCAFAVSPSMPMKFMFTKYHQIFMQVVRRHCSSYRRLGFIGTNGQTRHFIVQTGQHWHGSTGSAEERMMQLLRLVNGLLEKHPESRSRKLAAHAPIIVPVYSQVKHTPMLVRLPSRTVNILLAPP